eukprot:SAG11_NODE_7334_length_1159_cov_1.094340_1_plen_53_part_10
MVWTMKGSITSPVFRRIPPTARAATCAATPQRDHAGDGWAGSRRVRLLGAAVR